MSKSNKIIRTVAIQAANDLVRQFGPLCHKIEITGSIRREFFLVSDIEILCIPKVKKKVIKKKGQLFDNFEYKPVNFLFNRLESLRAKMIIKFIKNGPKYKQFIYYWLDESFKIDLFTAKQHTWGLQKMIRTGAKDYSKQFMIELNKKGEYQSKGGELINLRTGEVEPVNTEEKLYNVVGFPWKEPRDRSKWIFDYEED